MSVRDASVSNPLSVKNLYPTARGTTTASAGSAMSPGNTEDTSSTAPSLNVLERAFQTSILGEPVKAWIAIIVLLFGGMWLATRFGGNSTAANIKFSFYNVIVVIVLGIAGGAIAKVLAARFPIPGVSTIILAS